MSLDLYIISPEPVVRRGTGVYVREDGQTKELKTLEEVREHFPDADLSDIHVYEYEDEDFWHGNITHNMGEMASAVPAGKEGLSLYDLLWRPDEHGIDKAGAVGYRAAVLDGLLYLRSHEEELIRYNPENGWGNYGQLVRFTEDFLVHLIKAGDTFPVVADR